MKSSKFQFNQSATSFNSAWHSSVPTCFVDLFDHGIKLFDLGPIGEERGSSSDQHGSPREGGV